MALQAVQVQATIALDRAQAQTHQGKDVPAASPLDFEITVPDMSKVAQIFCLNTNCILFESCLAPWNTCYSVTR